MQQIERYGIIALLFLVVSIVVVALWDPEPGGSGREGPVEQTKTVAAAPARQETQRIAQAVQRPQQQPSHFSDRGAAPASGSRTARVVRSSSAPLDLGDEANGRRRGRNSNRREQQASSSRPVLPVAAAPTYSGGGTPTREKTQTNAGARRSPESLDAQRAADLAAGRRSRAEELAKARNPQPRSAPQPQDIVQRQREVPAKAALVAATTRRVSAPAQPKRATYVVRSGDSLERIARRELGDGARWREVAELNGIKNPNLVRVGQKLAMPAGAKVASVAPASQAVKQAVKRPVPGAKSAGNVYVVAKGDVLSRIAERELGSSKRWREIVELNPGLKPAKLYVGKKLKMPARGAQPAAPRPVAEPARTAVAQAPRRAASDDSRFIVH